MRDLEWMEIGVRGLKVPFAQWPTLLASCVPALIVGAVSVFCVAALNQTDIIGSDLARTTTIRLPLLAFGWTWMTALWHSTLRQALTFPIRSNFWMYLLVFGGLSIGGDAVASGIDAAIIHHIQGNAARIMTGAVRMLLMLPIIWIILRLTIWPAAVVASQHWVNPSAIWRATHGLAWDFLLLGLVVFVPVLFLGGGLVMGILFIFIASDSPYGTTFMFGGFGLLAIYGAAAWHAACLLAYHDVIVAPQHKRGLAVASTAN